MPSQVFDNSILFTNRCFDRCILIPESLYNKFNLQEGEEIIVLIQKASEFLEQRSNEKKEGRARRKK